MVIRFSASDRSSLNAAAKVSHKSGYPIIFTNTGVVYGNRTFIGFLPWDMFSPGVKEVGLEYPVVVSPKELMDRIRVAKVDSKGFSLLDVGERVYFDYVPLATHPDTRDFSCPDDLVGSLSIFLSRYDSETVVDTGAICLGNLADALAPWRSALDKKDPCGVRVVKCGSDPTLFVLVWCWGWVVAGITTRFTREGDVPKVPGWAIPGSEN